MAKFCGNCGAQWGDDARICGRCGTPLDGGGFASHPNPAGDRPRKRIKRMIVLLIAVLVLAAAGGTAYYVISNYTGAKGLLRKVMDAYVDYDIDTLMSLSGDMYYYGDEESLEQYLENQVGFVLDSLETSVGHSYRIAYEIEDVYPVSDRSMNQLLDSIAVQYPDFPADRIEEIAAAEVTVAAMQGEAFDSMDVTVTMSREDDSWKLLYLN